jgi:uncharacterized protein DUF1206
MSATPIQQVGSDEVAQAVRRNPTLVTLGRVGWMAKGLVYGILGFLALVIARNGGASSDEASPSGALAKIAHSTAGTAVLWILAVGLGLYSLWRLVSALLPGDSDARAWVTRTGYLFSAALYGFLAWSAVSFAQSKAAAAQAEQGDDAKVSRLTRDLMGHTGGRWLVGLVGVALLAIAAAFVHHGMTRKFEEDLEHAGVGPIRYETIVRLGVAGWIARAVTMALLGIFLIRAAVDYDPEQAEGLDDALRRTAGSSWGALLVAVTGVGLILYAAFAVISAPRQRLSGPS